MNAEFSLSNCPEHTQLLALAEGTLALEDTQVLETHVAACEHCDARLASMEERSDTLVRALASLPATDDDESTFRQLQAELLSRPERFGGNSDTTEAFESEVPLELILPLKLGNYELLEQIGAGAHGAVFRARHVRLEREVAIKLLLNAAGAAVEEFLNEMRIIGKLDHPHIVRATDAGEHDGIYFLVMEFVPGLDVSTLLREVGPLPVADACEVIRQTALGLEVAHANALVHRDVKTSNLLFTCRGQIKLLDLGLATIASGPATTGPSKIGPRGTADYMAPEQWAEASTVSASADIYSLGCTLFKLLAGVPPYRTLPRDFLSKQQAHESAPIPRLTTWREDVPPALEQFLHKMLAKDPLNRPASAEGVATYLKRYARDNALPHLASRVFPQSVAPRRLPAKPMSRRLLLTAGAVSAVAAATLLWPDRKSPSLRQSQWRPLRPADPPLIRVDSAEARFTDHTTKFELASNGPAMLQFGRPVGKRFHWRTALHREDWSTGAGVFFSLHRGTSKKLELLFYTLELWDDGETPRLQWVSYTSRDGTLDTPLVLAEAPVGIGLQNQKDHTFEVVIGRHGFPGVTVNKHHYPQTAWACATEARPLITTNVDQLPMTYSGRIGVFHHDGVTHTMSARLMYLDV